MSDVQTAEPASSGEPPAGAEQEEVRVPSWDWIWRLLGAIILAYLGTRLFLAAFLKVKEVFVWLFISLFASFALEPAVNYLSKRGWRRGVATGVLIFGLAIGAILVVALMVPLLVSQIQALIKAAPSILQTISDFTNRHFNVDVSPTALKAQLTNADSAVAKFAQNIAGNLFGFATSIIGTIFKMLTIGLFTFYLTADGPRFRRAICSFLPKKQQATVLFTWEVGIDKTGAYLYSRLLLAIFSGVATFIVLEILGIPFALPLAVWMGLVSQFVPTIGTYIAMALPLLVAVVKDPISALILLIFFTLYQQVENYLLSPRITSKTMQLHPALAFGCAIAGAQISGVVGAFLALPVAAIIQALSSTYIHRHDVEETELTRVSTPEEAKEIRESRRRENRDQVKERSETFRERMKRGLLRRKDEDGPD
jgi:predicted PurR-regulated permease PerM